MLKTLFKIWFVLFVFGSPLVSFASTAPIFHVHLSANQTGVPLNTETLVTFNTIDFDTTGAWNVLTYRFVPTVSGYYHFNCSVSPLNAPTTLNSVVAIAIRKNGADIATSQTSVQAVTNNKLLRTPISVLMFLNGSTDYADCTYRNSDGTNADISNSSLTTFFEGNLQESQDLSSSTVQSVDNPNQDYFNGVILFFGLTFTLVFVFKRRQ